MSLQSGKGSLSVTMRLGATIWHKPSESKLIYLGKHSTHLIRVRRLKGKHNKRREFGPVGLAFVRECSNERKRNGIL